MFEDLPGTAHKNFGKGLQILWSGQTFTFIRARKKFALLRCLECVRIVANNAGKTLNSSSCHRHKFEILNKIGQSISMPRFWNKTRRVSHLPRFVIAFSSSHKSLHGSEVEELVAVSHLNSRKVPLIFQLTFPRRRAQPRRIQLINRQSSVKFN